MSEPMRLAGMRNEYSNIAIAQLMRMMNMSGVLELITFICCSLRLPYHAKVMKVFEIISINTVSSALFIFLFYFVFFLYVVAVVRIVYCSCCPKGCSGLRGLAFQDVRAAASSALGCCRVRRGIFLPAAGTATVWQAFQCPFHLSGTVDVSLSMGISSSALWVPWPRMHLER